MNSTLKRQKSISSAAASISAWCAVFDWFSIVAATSVERHGPASSSAARRKTDARSSQGRRDQSACASRAASIACCDVLGAALGDVGEDVLLPVRHHRLGRLLRLDLLAADHHRDRDPLALHLREPDAQLLALGRARRVALDRLVDRRGRSEDARGAHGADCRVGADARDAASLRGRRLGRGGAVGRRRPRRRRPRPADAGVSFAGAMPETHPRGTPGVPTETLSRKSAREDNGFVPELLQRLHRYFAGEPVSFADVPLDEDWATPFQAALAGGAAQRALGRGRQLRRALRPRRPRAGGARRRHVLRREPLLALRPLPPRRLRRRHRRLRLARRRVQAPAARARGEAMALSDDLRSELAAIAPKRGCCRLAEVSALFHSAGSVHLRGRGGSRSISTSPPRASRAAPSRCCAQLGIHSEIRTYSRRAFDRATRYQLHVSGRRRRARHARRGGRPRRAARAARAAAEAGRRPRLLPRRLPARRAARRRLALGPALAPSRAAHDLARRRRVPPLRRRRRRRAPWRARPRPPCRRLREGLRRDRVGAHARRARATRCSPSRSGRSSRPRAARRTGSRTPTTPTSSARAAPRRSSSRPSALCSATGALERLPDRLYEVARLRLRYPTAAAARAGGEMRPTEHESLRPPPAQEAARARGPKLTHG